MIFSLPIKALACKLLGQRAKQSQLTSIQTLLLKTLEILRKSSPLNRNKVFLTSARQCDQCQKAKQPQVTSINMLFLKNLRNIKTNSSPKHGYEVSPTFARQYAFTQSMHCEQVFGGRKNYCHTTHPVFSRFITVQILSVHQI